MPSLPPHELIHIFSGVCLELFKSLQDGNNPIMDRIEPFDQLIGLDLVLVFHNEDKKERIQAATVTTSEIRKLLTDKQLVATMLKAQQELAQALHQKLASLSDDDDLTGTHVFIQNPRPGG